MNRPKIEIGLVGAIDHSFSGRRKVTCGPVGHRGSHGAACDRRAYPYGTAAAGLGYHYLRIPFECAPATNPVQRSPVHPRAFYIRQARGFKRHCPCHLLIAQYYIISSLLTYNKKYPLSIFFFNYYCFIICILFYFITIVDFVNIKLQTNDLVLFAHFHNKLNFYVNRE